jgi:putative ABC transport system ATP-binding protein
MGLETRLKSRAGTLSGGQRQALTLLLACMVPPKLLLLDEHTAALDPLAAKKIQALTLEIAAGKSSVLPPTQFKNKTIDDTAAGGAITTLMITHNILTALEMGTRTIMMRQGRIVMDLRGEERKFMTVEKLLEKYRETTGEELAADEMILEK